MSQKTFFVAGITGNVGGAAARHLLAQGHALRTLARNPAKAAAWAAQGVDVREGEFTDAAAFIDALHAVDGAFVMVPPYVTPAPGYPESKAVIAAISQALRQAAPPRVVALSSIGSEQTSGLGLITATHLLEQSLAGLPCPTAFVRAGSFMQNFLPSLAPAAASGILHTFYQPTDRPVPTIATQDIGHQVATLLTGDWPGTKIIELGSPISPDEIAQAMAAVLGRPVHAQSIPRDRWAATWESFGMPPGSSWAYEEMCDSINSGWIHFGNPNTEPIPATLTPTQVFQQASKP